MYISKSSKYTDWRLYTQVFPVIFSYTYNNNNNNLFIYSALFNMLGDQKRITTINNLKTIQKLEVYKFI